jgi:hypothetical protein
MAVPTSGTIEMLKLARERKGFGYTSSGTITSPIHLSDLSRLSGGNSSGSGTSYPAVNLLNPSTSRPDGSDPQSMGEFRGYEQNLARAAFEFLYSATSSNNACAFGLPDGTVYYHTDGSNQYPSALDGTFFAYTTATGFTPVSAGFYQVFDTSGFSTNKFIQTNSSGAIIGGGNC